jgi:hypothetical protein
MDCPGVVVDVLKIVSQAACSVIAHDAAKTFLDSLQPSQCLPAYCSTCFGQSMFWQVGFEHFTRFSVLGQLEHLGIVGSSTSGPVAHFAVDILLL